MGVEIGRELLQTISLADLPALLGFVATQANNRAV
jgi:hypothetical protein